MIRKRCWGALALALFLAASLGTVSGARAQQPVPNLLTNGDLETPYYAQGAPTRTVPQGWGLWIGAGTPDALPNKDSPQVRSGAVAWHLRQNGAVFTAAGYQQVSEIAPGTVLELVAHGWAFACADAATRCAIPTFPYAQSDEAAGTTLRVGLDPTGGLDPLSSAVQWSADAAPYDQWAALRVTATAQAETVTVYLFMTQQTPLALNGIYWDAVSLSETSGEGAASGTASVVATTPSPTAPPPTATPTPTPTLTPTPLAPLPAALAAETGTLCVTAFHDENLNAARDPDEAALPDLRLLVTGTDRVITLISAEDSDPLCTEFAPGWYEIAAMPPDGFGLTGSGTALIQVFAGREVAAAFGAAPGYVATPLPASEAPTVEAGAPDPGLVAPSLDAAGDSADDDSALLDQLYEYSGLLVLAAAVLIGGGGALVLLALRREA
ncbi:MAG: hypothetical protein KJ047_10465 [Anaerolineae bacterium]|mgnify:CR=1 FL=1|nr:hypothetical protein [Anaerolineae bacterium]